MAFAEKLFGVFQRLHAAGEFEGIGIGLALLCRLIAGSFRSHRKFFVKRIDAGSPA
jgi:light-regulated signal transduction histidine kinase (bacteriophytochrome)